MNAVQQSCLALMAFSLFMIVLSNIAMHSKKFFKRMLVASIWLFLAHIAVDFISKFASLQDIKSIYLQIVVV
jgi:hypothetical protein